MNSALPGTYSIENCYNAGELEGETMLTGGIVGGKNSGKENSSIINSFYLDNVEKSCLYKIGENDSEKLTQAQIKSQETINKLNNGISSDSNLSNWILGDNGYPTLKE